jgi:hypothetical protein
LLKVKFGFFQLRIDIDTGNKIYFFSRRRSSKRTILLNWLDLLQNVEFLDLL